MWFFKHQTVQVACFSMSPSACWYCHQSGSSDVVDLPDVLLPEGQCLDMFDSESDHSGDLSDDEVVEVP